MTVLAVSALWMPRHGSASHGRDMVIVFRYSGFGGVAGPTEIRSYGNIVWQRYLIRFDWWR